MRTPSRLLTLLTATAAATATLVLVSPPGAHAAPEPVVSSMYAPYALTASFETFERGCDETTTCQIKGSADALTGRSTVAASYQRSQPVSTDGGAYGRTRQAVSYSVPRGATTVTAVLTYRVNSASASAGPTVGSVSASAWLTASFPFDINGCKGSQCRQSRRVVSTTNANGVPGPAQHVSEPYIETLAVTATGTLPRTLLLHAETSASSGGGGSYGACIGWDGCGNVDLYAHAGTAEAAVDATFLSVQFNAS